MKIIETEADIKSGMRALKRKCPLMRMAHRAAGDPPLRRSVAGYEGLARIVVGQQVSIASANAIWGRLAATLTPFDAAGFTRLDDDCLRSVGLSAGKVRTLRATAQALTEGTLDLDGFAALPDEEVRSRLVALKGIGPWTADVYLLFCLGRADAFAPGDLALQVAAARLLGNCDRLSAAELSSRAETWQPWRGVAARMLWAYYRVSGNASSGLPV